MNNNFNKKIAAFLAATAASIFIVSVAYIAAEADHDCTGDDCPVCACVVQCLTNLRLLGAAAETQTESFSVEKFFVPKILICVRPTVPVTLINQKVRLDD